MGAFADDRLDYYSADLGPSQAVALVAGASTASGKLRPGRYLAQIIDAGTDRAWLRVGPWSAASPVAATIAVPSTPFGAGGPNAFEFNVRPGHSDQIAGIMAAGTCSLILTPLSRQAKRVT